jgi:hypothetical protein
MTKLALILCVLAAACTPKPTEEQCAQAVENIRHLTAQTRAEGGIDPKMAIRSCRARSTRETVTCQINAKSLDELVTCEGEEGKKFLEAQRKAEAEAAKKAPPADEAAPTPPAEMPGSTPTPPPAAAPPRVPPPAAESAPPPAAAPPGVPPAP